MGVKDPPTSEPLTQWGYRLMPLHSAFYVSSRDLNSGLQVCVADASAAEPSPQPIEDFRKCFFSPFSHQKRQALLFQMGN